MAGNIVHKCNKFCCFLCLVNIVGTWFLLLFSVVLLCCFFFHVWYGCLPEVAGFCLLACENSVAIVCDGYLVIGEGGNALSITLAN